MSLRREYGFPDDALTSKNKTKNHMNNNDTNTHMVALEVPAGTNPEDFANDPIVQKALEMFKRQAAEPEPSALDINSPDALEARAKELREASLKAESERLAQELGVNQGLAALIYGSDEEYKKLIIKRHPGALAFRQAERLVHGEAQSIYEALELFGKCANTITDADKKLGSAVQDVIAKVRSWLDGDRLSTCYQKWRRLLNHDPQAWEYHTCYAPEHERALYLIELKALSDSIRVLLNAAAAGWKETEPESPPVDVDIPF